MSSLAGKFRQSFQFGNGKIVWYPGHMNSSFRHMQALMRKVDCIVEVHDSRIPFSGRNPNFLFNLFGTKPHILILNKKDLINKLSFDAIKEKCFENNCENVIFTNCLNQKCEGLNEIIPLALKLIQKNKIYPLTSELTMMVIGVPNVGKSSVINALRNISLAKGRASRIGAEPGITRAVLNKIKVLTDPPMYLIDTPGILEPSIKDVESGMKLALCACLKDSIVGVDVIADFLLYWMNKTENFSYVKQFGLEEPIDHVLPLLVKIAVEEKMMRKMKSVTSGSVEIVPDIESAARSLVSSFRRGDLGDLNLDKDHLIGL